MVAMDKRVIEASNVILKTMQALVNELPDEHVLKRSTWVEQDEVYVETINDEGDTFTTTKRVIMGMIPTLISEAPRVDVMFYVRIIVDDNALLILDYNQYVDIKINEALFGVAGAMHHAVDMINVAAWQMQGFAAKMAASLKDNTNASSGQ